MTKCFAAVLVAAAGTVLVAGCGDDDNAARPGGDAGAADGPVFVDAAFPEDGSPQVAPITTVDLPDTPCSPRGGSERVLYPAASPVASFAALRRVGARRVGATPADGFSLFDTDGANPSPSPVVVAGGPSSTASTGPRVLSAWQAQGTIFAALHDENGLSVNGLALAVASEPAASVVAGGGGGVGLVAWADGQVVRARGVTPDATLAPGPFLLAEGIPSLDWSASIAHVADKTFGVAWAAGIEGDYRVYFHTATTEARTGLPRRLLTLKSPAKILSLTATKTGFAILARYDDKPHVILLDAEGKVVSPIRRVLGAFRGVGVAASGDEIGVLVIRPEVEADSDAGTIGPGAAAFRPLAATGDPLGPWVCLGKAPAGRVDAAIDADADGYAVTHRTGAGDLALVRFDRRGTGP